ncbi:hypothetical protein HAX54_015694, partial [Datura stramonium]|nr:hypothetical protein [Datura stramonium]
HYKEPENVKSVSDYVEPLMHVVELLPPDDRLILVGHGMGGLAMEKFPKIGTEHGNNNVNILRLQGHQFLDLGRIRQCITRNRKRQAPALRLRGAVMHVVELLPPMTDHLVGHGMGGLAMEKFLRCFC